MKLLNVLLYLNILVFRRFANSHNNGLKHNKTVICYVETTAVNTKGRGAFHLSDINTNLCSHVIFAFVRLKRDDTFNPLVSWYEFFGEDNKFLEFKRNHPHVKYLVAIGGWHEGTRNFVRISHFESRRKKFAQNAVKFARENGFDGIDLCWLYPSKRDGSLADKHNFVELLKELRTQLHKHDLLLTAMIGSSYETIEHGYDVAEISKAVDIMNVLCYDYNGFWSPTIAPNSPMESTDKWNVKFTIERLVELGADPSKMVLGMPQYGWSFLATNTSHRNNSHVMFGDQFVRQEDYSDDIRIHGVYTDDKSGIFLSNEICLELKDADKWRRYWDEISSTPYAVHKNYLISYDDVESYAIKVKYAMMKKMRGVVVFPLNGDDFRGDCSKNTTGNTGYDDYPNLRTINANIEEYLET